MVELSYINSNLLYDILSIPSYSGMENKVQAFLSQYAEDHQITITQDWKGNIYMTKGKVEKDCFFPCLTAHMDTIHYEQIPYVEGNLPITLKTQTSGNGKHMIYADGDFGLGGDDKAGIVIALSVMEHLDTCKAVFFVEEEIGCKGSDNTDLSWFADVGYVIGFDSPGTKQASWSCNGIKLFDKAFYDTYLEPFHKEFGLTRYVAHPYTDVLMLRINTSLACMNMGAGYHNQHSSSEYVVPEEMDKTVAMSLALIANIGYKECVIPYTSPRSKKDDKDYDYFETIFKNIEKARQTELTCDSFENEENSIVDILRTDFPQLKKKGYKHLPRLVELWYSEDWYELESYLDVILDLLNDENYPSLDEIPHGCAWEIIDYFSEGIKKHVEQRKEGSTFKNRIHLVGLHHPAREKL